MWEERSEDKNPTGGHVEKWYRKRLSRPLPLALDDDGDPYIMLGAGEISGSIKQNAGRAGGARRIYRKRSRSERKLGELR